MAQTPGLIVEPLPLRLKLTNGFPVNDTCQGCEHPPRHPVATSPEAPSGWERGASQNVCQDVSVILGFDLPHWDTHGVYGRNNRRSYGSRDALPMWWLHMLTSVAPLVRSFRYCDYSREIVVDY